MASSKKARPNATRNLVQCYSLRVNRAATHVDRKKQEKAGGRKHRGAYLAE